MIRTLLKPLSFIPALLLMYMIFSFSAQPGEVSAQMSYKVSYKIVQAADYIFDAGLEEWQIGEWANKIHFITRKLAHMTEYFALAVAVSFPLYVYGLHGILLMLVAGLICVGFACGDECHQAFVAGRGPSVKDVCIDSVGVFFGIIFVRIIGWTGRKTIFKPKEKVKKARSKKGKYIEDDYYEDDYREAPYRTDGRHQEPPYRPDDRYREPPYRPDGRYQEPPYRADDRYYEPPYRPDDRYREPPYRPDGRYQEPPYRPDDRYQEPPYRPDDRYQEPPYEQADFRQTSYNRRNGYQEIPYERENDRYTPEDDWFDEEDIDIDSAPDASYDAGWEDPSRADDWGMDAQPPRPDKRAPVQKQPPRPAPETQPKRKKRAKKEKDWFFDM